MKINLDKDEEITYEVQKSLRTGIEGFIGFLIVIPLIILQYDTIVSFYLFLKIFLILGLLLLFLEDVNSFFVELILTNKRIFIKNIFTLGKTLEVKIHELKNISANKFFMDSLNRGYLILFRKKKHPIWVGTVPNIDILGKKIREEMEYINGK